MMSFCGMISAIAQEKRIIEFNEDLCVQYEEADKKFSLLVKEGVISKRGYQLLPIKSKVCTNLNINYGISEK